MTDDEIMRILEDHEERIKHVESSSGEFQTFREVINVKLDAITASLTELKEAVISLKQKPAARWETLIASFIAAGASAVITYFMAGR